MHGARRTEQRDATKSRKWLFLVLDILLLAAIVATIFFLVVLLTPLNPFAKNHAETVDVLYAVEFSNVDGDVFELLSSAEGQSVVDAATGKVIGEVRMVDKRAYSFYTDVAVKEGDNYVVGKETSMDKYTVTVTLSARAEYEEGVGYTVDNSRVAVGRTYELHFPSYAGSGTCVTLVRE
jgi:hypothetical protein